MSTIHAKRGFLQWASGIFFLVMSHQAFSQSLTITSFSPTTAGQRDTVTITGTNFFNTTYVAFAGTPAITYRIINSTTLIAVVGYGIQGTTGSITVIDNGRSVVAPGFTHAGPPPPSINSLSPVNGTAGTAVTINGINFNTVPEQNLVYFGKAKATVTAATSTSLTVTASGGATYEPVTVTTHDFTAFAGSAFTATFPDGGFLVPSSFVQNKDVITPTTSYEIAVGDIDGDGKVDVAVPNNGQNTFSVFRNTSTVNAVSFSMQSFPAGDIGSGIALGDLSGDGKPEVIILNDIGGASSISVFRNTSVNGVISFGARKDYRTGYNDYSYPQKAVVADLDDDGRPELVVANGDNSLSLFKNVSNFAVITLEDRINYPIGTNATGLTVCDLDGDKKPDIATANSSSNNISVLKNMSHSNGLVFANAATLPAASGPSDIVSGDLDNDGKPDIAVVNTNEGSLSIYKNTSKSNDILFEPAVNFPGLYYPKGIAVCDLDGDSKPDVAVTNDGPSGAVSVFKNTTANGTFSLLKDLRYNTVGAPIRIFTADMDGDGTVDLVTTNPLSQRFGVLRNHVKSVHITSFEPLAGGAGTMVTIHGRNLTKATDVSFGGEQAASFTIVNDTVITAVVGAGQSGEVKVTSLDGNGTAPGFTYYTIPIITSFEPLAGETGSTVTITGANFSDVPSDNIVYFGAVKATVLTASSGSITVQVPTGVGTGPVSVTTGNLTAYADRPFNVIFPGAPAAFLPTSFEDKVDVPINAPSAVCAADLDLDGKPELLVPDFSYDLVGQLSILLNNSMNGIVSFAVGNVLETPRSPLFVNAADFDGDGKLDILIGGDQKAVYRNTSSPGSISFAPKIDLAFGNAPQAIADINRDGKPDIVTFNGITVYVYRNTTVNGVISFTQVIYGTSGSGSYVGSSKGIAVSDLNGDYKPDVMLTFSSDDFISVFPNTSANGTISSGAELVLPTGDGPMYNVVTRDIDSDGRLDIIAENYNGSSFSVLKNTSVNGVMSFAAKVDIATNAANPAYMEVADLDGDGRPDAVLAHSYAGSGETISLVKNTSTQDIAFGSKLEVISGRSPHGVCINDLDNDGKPEIVIPNLNANTVSIFRNRINEPLILAAGSNPVSGPIMNNIDVHETVPTYNGRAFVQRYYEIEPANDPDNATAQITLYFTQQDFDNYNDHPLHGVNLPQDASDATGIANIRVYQYHGTSVTGMPGSYSGGEELIDPDDDKIIWNPEAQWWEITFPVTGFSGFFVTSASGDNLPLTWLSFDARKEGGVVHLSWSTSEEVNTRDFVVERSMDGVNFISLDTLIAKGNAIRNDYSYKDPVPSGGYVYYRILQVDHDNRFEYSRIVMVNLAEESTGLKLKPNPASGFVRIQLPGNMQQATVQIFSENGSLLKTLQAIDQQFVNVYDLARGVYYVVVKGGRGYYTEKLVIQ